MNPVYLLVGQERFLKKEFIRDLVRTHFANDPNASLNVQEFSAGEHPLSAALEFIQTAPFLSPKRMAVLWEVESLSEEDRAILLSSLARLSPRAVLVLVSDESGVKKNRFLAELAGRAKLVPCHAPFERDLASWVKARAAKSSKKLDAAAADVLIARVGGEVSILQSAIEQLAVFTDPRPAITASDVSLLFGKSAEEDVFSLADAVLAGDAAAALEKLHALFRDGVRAVEITAALAGQLDRFQKAARWIAEGRAPAEIGAELRVPPFFQQKFFTQAKRLGREALAGMAGRLLDCDEAIKTGRMDDRLALEKFVLEPVFSARS